MVGNSGRDHNQKSKSDSTGYPSHSPVSTRRDDPREMRDAQNASEDKLCGLRIFLGPKRSLMPLGSGKPNSARNCPTFHLIRYGKTECKKGDCNDASNRSPAWLLVDFGSK